MRISTSQIYERGVAALLEQQTALAKTQQQLSSGKRILTPADDPGGAAQALDLTRALEATGQYQKNSDAASARLGLTENTLQSVNDLLQRVRELAVQGANDSQSAESRRDIAAEVRQRLGQLVALANTRDASGEYLFAGFQGHTAPFTANAAGGFDYAGDQGRRLIEVAPGQSVAATDSGADIFQRIAEGNGVYAAFDDPANAGTAVIAPEGQSGAFVADVYTIAFSQASPASPITYSVSGASSGVVATGNYAAGSTLAFNGVQVSISGTPADGDRFTVRPAAKRDMFGILGDLASALESGADGGAALARFHNATNRTLADLDQALGGLIDVRATIGARHNELDALADSRAGLSAALTQSLSQVQDLDYAEAASRLNQQLVALQAAQAAFAKVQGLSLFNYLR